MSTQPHDGPTPLTIAGIALVVLGVIAFEPAMDLQRPLLYVVCFAPLAIGATLVCQQRLMARARA